MNGLNEMFADVQRMRALIAVEWDEVSPAMAGDIHRLRFLNSNRINYGITAEVWRNTDTGRFLYFVRGEWPNTQHPEVLNFYYSGEAPTSNAAKAVCEFIIERQI